MRKDSINEAALEKAYLIFSEHGIKTVDFSHKSTDYKRGTVEEPEQVSNIDGRYAELLPENVRDDGKFEELKSQAGNLNMQIDKLQAKMVTCRQRGNFGDLQTCMKKMAMLTKEKERVDAAMAVDNLGRAQSVASAQTMDQDERYSEMTAREERIAALEARIIEFTEG